MSTIVRIFVRIIHKLIVGCMDNYVYPFMLIWEGLPN